VTTNNTPVCPGCTRLSEEVTENSRRKIITPPSAALALTCRTIYQEFNKLYEDTCIRFWAADPFSNPTHTIVWKQEAYRGDLLHVLNYATEAQLQQSAAFQVETYFSPYRLCGIKKTTAGPVKWILRLEGFTPTGTEFGTYIKKYWRKRAMNKRDLKEWVKDLVGGM
jgi:hypothetical protein